VTRLAAVALAACLAAARAGAQDAAPLPAETYQDQLTVRLYGSTGRLDLYTARVAIHDENGARQDSFWTGSIYDGGLRDALGGGLEISWGALEDVKFLFELGGFGSAATGTFTGTGPNAVTDPVLGRLAQRVDRVSRYPVFTQVLGATVLMRSFEWCRFGLTGRLGVCELAGAVERGSSSGPFGRSWWSQGLSGTAPSVFFGIEWEWLSAATSLGSPVTGVVLLGYRMLQFTSVTAAYADSSGVSRTSDWTNPDGSHRTLDLSGPEARIGIQMAFSLPPTP
jgi:hypothetical protein